MMELSPAEQKHPSIVVVGGDSSIQYLLQRYAERIGYTISFEKSPLSAEAVQRSEPEAVIFPSIEILEGSQVLAAELTNLDIPIIVCSTVFDQERTRELGADYCLLHPLVFDSFSTTVHAAVKPRTENQTSEGEEQKRELINPV